MKPKGGGQKKRDSLGALGMGEEVGRIEGWSSSSLHYHPSPPVPGEDEH